MWSTWVLRRDPVGSGFPHVVKDRARYWLLNHQLEVRSHEQCRRNKSSALSVGVGADSLLISIGISLVEEQPTVRSSLNRTLRRASQMR